MKIDFFYHLIILLSLMLAFTCFRVANCRPFNESGEDFNLRKLLLGIAKHLIVIVGGVVVFIAGSYYGNELLLIQLGETKVTIQSAIDLTTLAILTFYSAKYIRNLAEFAGISKRVPEAKALNEVQSQGYTLSLDYNVASDETVEGQG